MHQRLKGMRKEMYEERIGEVSDRYIDLWRGSVVRPRDGDLAEQLSAQGGVRELRNWVHYDVEHEAQLLSRHVLPYLEQSLREVRHSVFAPGLDPALWNLGGNVSASSILLAGDVVGCPGSAAPWPFYHNGNSSAYLMETLHKLGYPEEKLAYVNVNDTQLRHVLDAAGLCRRVVALGNEASKGLERLGIQPYAQVRHPQHANRFTRNDGTYLGEFFEVLP
jgi:hypothetical protein